MSNRSVRPGHEKLEIPDVKLSSGETLAYHYLVMIVNIGISIYNFIYAKSVLWGSATGIIALYCLVDVIIKTRRRIKDNQEKYAQQKLSEYIELEMGRKERVEDKNKKLQAQQEEEHRLRQEESERRIALATARLEAEKAGLIFPSGLENAPQEKPEAPAKINGLACAYQYEKVYFAPEDRMAIEPLIGHTVTTKKENDEVAIYFQDTLIGKMKPGKLRDMVSDWLDRHDPMWLMITRVDDAKREAAFDLYLYRDEMAYLLQRDPDAKKYKLIGTTSDEMQDRLDLLSIGQKCEVSYDGDRDKYAVLDGWEIGYLPPSARRIVEQTDEDDIRAFVADIQVNDQFKKSVYVYLFV